MSDSTNTPGGGGHFWRLTKVLVCLYIVGGAIWLYQQGFFQLFLDRERVIEFIQSLGPFGFLGFILLQPAQEVLAPIPGELTGIIGGFLFGVVGGTVLSTIGLILGSFIAFSISRAFGRPFVERFVDKAIMDRFDYLLHHKGVFLIFMLFLLPGFPKDYLCFILGLGHLTTCEFLVISSVGRLFGTVLLTLGGGFIRYQQYTQLYVLAGVAVAVMLTAWLFRTRLENLLSSLHKRKGHLPAGTLSKLPSPPLSTSQCAKVKK